MTESRWETAQRLLDESFGNAECGVKGDEDDKDEIIKGIINFLSGG